MHSTAIPSRFWRERHFDEIIPSRCCSIDSGHYRRAVLPYYGPDIGAEDDQSEFPTLQVLLIPDVLIGSNQYFEPGLFRHLQKLAVFQLIGPQHFDESLNLMLEQEAARTDRDIFIKQYAQRGDP